MELSVYNIKGEDTARKVTLNEKKLTKYFPKNYTSEDVEKVIESLLEKWKQEQEVM